MASCIVIDLIDTVTQVRVFITGINASHQRFYLTQNPHSSLEEAYTIALREDFIVMSSHMEQSSYHRAAQEPESMDIDAIERDSHPRCATGDGIRKPWR